MKSKIFIIIRHEFLAKVKSKGFVLSTFLAPLGLLMVIIVPIVVTIFAKDTTSKSIAIVDPNNEISTQLVQSDSQTYFNSPLSIDSLQSLVKESKIDGYIVIPTTIDSLKTIQYYSNSGGSLTQVESIESTLEKTVRAIRMKKSGIDSTMLKDINAKISVDVKKVSTKGIENYQTKELAAIGYVAGMLIYVMILLYGMYVSRGVIEEKANRIVEVMASSVSPFQLMLGKIIGIGSVGLFQILLWISLVLVLGIIVPIVLALIPGMSVALSPEMVTAITQSKMQGMNGMVGSTPSMFTPSIGGFQIPTISPLLVFVFLGNFIIGYFMYSSLFAGVGAAVDQESDAQQLQGPIMIPIIIPVLLMMNVVMDPNGTMSVILSLIPFFSPTLMVVRVAVSEVPIWQIIVSYIGMIAMFFLFVTGAAKIYRIGILMYGKKVSLGELFRWLFQKN
jgi:ABC-2 type transport system permease protein